jgi:uncharacterized protein
MSRHLLIVVLLVMGCSKPAPQPMSEVRTDSAVERPNGPVGAQLPKGSLAGSETDAATESMDNHKHPASMPKSQQSLDELLLFFPQKLDPGAVSQPPPPFADVRIVTDDGVILSVWYAAPPRPVAVVLFLHGNGGNLFANQNLPRWLVDQARCTVLAVDYRGYGLSEGMPTVEGVLSDVRAARRDLVQRAGVKECDVILMGHSLGAALAVQIASESPPRALVLQSAFSSLADIAEVHFGKLSALIPEGRLDSVATLTKYSGPVFQSHGDADAVVPIALGEKLQAAAREPKQFLRLPGADHNRVLTPEYLHELRTFLDGLP